MKKVSYSGMKQNNQGSAKGGSKTPGCSNSGATGGLRKESGSNQGAMTKPNTKNMYPNGLS